MTKQFSIFQPYPLWYRDGNTISHHDSTLRKSKIIHYSKSKGILENIIKNFHNLAKNTQKSNSKDTVKNSRIPHSIFIKPCRVGQKKRNTDNQGGCQERIVSTHSKPFKIRQKHKKFARCKGENETIQSSTFVGNKSYQHSFFPSPYRLNCLRNISCKVEFEKSKINQKKGEDWAVFIPAPFLMSKKLTIREKIFRWFLQGIKIFIKTNTDEERKSIITTYDFVNVLQTPTNSLAHSWVFFNLEGIELPKYLLFIDVLSDYPTWYPYLQDGYEPIFIKCNRNEELDQISVDLSHNLITYVNQSEEISLQPSLENKKLQEQIRLLDLHHYMKTKRRKIKRKQNNFLSLENSLQSIMTDQSTANHQKLTELIKNNRHIHRQIQSYISETLEFSWPLKPMDKLAIDAYIFN